MDMTRLNCEEFLKVSGPIIDVRSPAEFASGHIPSAINMPLLSNDERVIIGTLYKQVSPEAALIEGLKIAGPKFANFVSQALQLTDKKISIYCWRGGMRSSFMASLFSLAKLDVTLLEGGYKTFRQHALDLFQSSYQLKILGGHTGSGKTEILKELNLLGEQVIDLEGLASHRGSAFGSIGQEKPQPSNEHFENLIASKLFPLDINRPIWIEDESRTIGQCTIPNDFFSQMRTSPLYVIEVPKSDRILRIQKEYAPFGYQHLVVPTKKLEKRLGNQRMQEALECIENNDPYFFSLLLDYYDKAYNEMTKRRGGYNCTFIPAPFSIEKLVPSLQVACV